MIHLKTGNNLIGVIPRRFVDGEIKAELINESTRVKSEYLVDASTSGNYMFFTLPLTVTDGDFYMLTISENNEVIYKDKAFATSQDIDQLNNDYYTVNQGEYTEENSSDNNFIFI
jgi:hypothetical protein